MVFILVIGFPFLIILGFRISFLYKKAISWSDRAHGYLKMRIDNGDHNIDDMESYYGAIDPQSFWLNIFKWKEEQFVVNQEAYQRVLLWEAWKRNFNP